MMAKKKKAKPVGAKSVGSHHSPIIEQCVIYVQQLAAYDAGFSVDRTDNADYCHSRQIKRARRAMIKLIGLSSHCKAGAPVVTALELHAKAAVISAMYGLRKDDHPDEIETAYIRFFAGEVSDFLEANNAVQPYDPLQGR